jgi:hypothetical protein
MHPCQSRSDGGGHANKNTIDGEVNGIEMLRKKA